MTPTDPKTLMELVISLEKIYGAVESKLLRHANYRVWHNPWYLGGRGDGSFIFITNKGNVRSGNNISTATFMSDVMMKKIILGQIPRPTLTDPTEPCLSPSRTKPIDHTGETTMAKAATGRKAPAKTEKKAKVEKTAPVKKEAAPKKAAAPKTPREVNPDAPRIDRSRYEYSSSGTKSASGRKTVNNGDALAKALEGKSADDVVALVREHDAAKVKVTWGNLNEGMRRMSAGNVLRGILRNAGVLTIDGKKVRAPAQVAA